MWLTVVMLVTSAFWLALRAEKCGKRLPVISPPQPHDGSKTEALPNSWPWHVGLYYSGYGAFPVCGGTLISPTWVLTAAHCLSMMFACKNIPLGQPFTLDEFTNETLVVKVGSHNLDRDHPLAYNVLVKHVIIHPSYQLFGPRKDSDFVLLKLRRKVKQSKTVGFACLPKPGFKFNEGKSCYFAGWGLIALFGGELFRQAEVLMEKPVTIARPEVCAAVLNPIPTVNEICGQQSNTTNCYGDSGGGLHCQTEDSHWTLYGVLERGSLLCNEGVGVFGSTDYALTWIKQVMQAFN